MVEPDGERTFVTSPGIEAHAKKRALADVALQDRDAVFVSGYDLSYLELGPAITAWIPSLPPDAVLVLDPGPLVAGIPDAVLEAVLPRVDILTMNHREATLLTKSDDLSRIFEWTLPRLRTGALLIVRQGKAGCILGGGFMGDKRVEVPAPAVRMIDATGAGDAHTGVFIAGLASGLDPISAAARANAAAALAVTKPGSATAPGARELDAFLAAGQNIA
jgi:sugar/nucleoside kinase (ribokinase family)